MPLTLRLALSERSIITLKNTGKGSQINTERKPQTGAIKGKRPRIDLAFES